MILNYDHIAKVSGVARDSVKRVLHTASFSGGVPGPDYEALLLSLIAGMGLCDHMGDVADDVFEVVKRMGITVPEDVDLGGLRAFLGHKHGAVSLWGGDSTFTPVEDCAGCYNPLYLSGSCTCAEDDDAEV